jgi:molecular chaperone GrpE (heat shock protein)
VTDDRLEAEAAEEAPEVDVNEAVDVESIARERDEYLDALQRLKAEFDNYRKRVGGGRPRGT